MSLDEACNEAMSRYLDDGFNALTPDEQLLVVIWALEAEVNNGGFHQYYFNSSGDFARYASRMLREIGAKNMAQIVDEANAVFGPVGPPDNRDERQKALETIDDDSWDQLDNKFCANPDNVSELLSKHLGL
jgi:hypothetical protein